VKEQVAAGRSQIRGRPRQGDIIEQQPVRLYGIRIWGIVISGVEDREIVEDFAASDSLDLIRQLGPWRTLLLGIDWLRNSRG
jgi:hypothetical protein